MRKRKREYLRVQTEDEVTLQEALVCALEATIRKLNYMYDVERDEARKEDILNWKARLILNLLLLEEKKS